MFKFGKYVAPKGPYEKYRDPVSHIKRATGSVAGSPQQVTANFGPMSPVAGGGFCGPGGGGGGTVPGLMNPGGSDFGGGGGQGFNNDRYNPVYDQLEEGTVLEDWIPRDGAGQDLLFRRMYLRDPILGPGIDIIRNLPWSDYSLSGIQDKKVLQIFEDSLEALHLPLLMPDLTGDHLVVGRNILSVIFNERKGIFSGVVPHDPDFIRVRPLPVYGFDPLCDFKLSPGFRQFINSTDPRAMDARKALPPAFLQAAQSNLGFLPLDPVATIYLARKASQHDQVGTSLLTRCLYFWAIEKALLNAQLTSTRRRSRSFIHLMAGIDNVWEPQREELDALAGMIISANEDPVGGVIATRTGVTINEPVSGGADFYKWSDELDLFSKYKMHAIGISEALLSGDTTYNNAEQARSVFVENLATMRFRIVHKMFYQGLFPTLSRLHGFQKRTRAEIDHNIRITPSVESARLPVWARNNMSQYESNRLTVRKSMQIPISDLLIPQIDWSKQLKPNQDEKYLDILEKLKNNDYPVTLKQWAQAAGLNPDTIAQDAAADKKMRAKIEGIEVNTAPPPDEAGDGGGGAEDETPEAPPGDGGDTPISEEEGAGGAPDLGPSDAPAEDLPPLPKLDPSDGGELPPDVIVPETVRQSVQGLLKKIDLSKQAKGIY